MCRPARRPGRPAGIVLAILAALAAAPGPPPAAADVWVAEAELQASAPFSAVVTVDDGADVVTLELTGPDDRTVSLGFGALVMPGTYAVVAYPAGTAEERTLGSYDPGIVLAAPSIASAGFAANGDGTVTHTLERPRDPGLPGVWAFPEGGASVPVIWAVHPDGGFGFHGPANRGGLTMPFEPGGAVSAPETGVVEASWGRTRLVFRKID